MSYKVQKPCKICGNLYTPCGDCENDKSSFHWRNVACSIECGIKYLKKVEDARKNKSVVQTKMTNKDFTNKNEEILEDLSKEEKKETNEDVTPENEKEVKLKKRKSYIANNYESE